MAEKKTGAAVLFTPEQMTATGRELWRDGFEEGLRQGKAELEAVQAAFEAHRVICQSQWNRLDRQPFEFADNPPPLPPTGVAITLGVKVAA